MIRFEALSVDTNILVMYLEKGTGRCADLLQAVIDEGNLVLAPPVLAEFLSKPGIPYEVVEQICKLPLFNFSPFFWRRTGQLRAQLYVQKYRPKLVDTIIAQCCIENQTPLLTMDTDFKCFVPFGLQLVRTDD